MFRKLLTVIFVFVLYVFQVSCSDLGQISQFNTNDQYVVKPRTLYVRSAPSTTSLITATYHQGDTLQGKPSDSQWVLLSLPHGAVGFVLSESVEQLGSEALPVFDLFDHLTNWKTWGFWLTSVVLVGLWVALVVCSVNFKNRLKTRHSVSIKGLQVMPVVLFVFGIMGGVLYSTWNEAFISSVQNTFSFSPSNLDAIGWVLWVQILVSLIALLYDILAAIFVSGVQWGAILTLIDFILGLVIWLTAFFLTVALQVVGIVLLVIFFATQYTAIVSKNNRRVKLYQRPK